MSLKSKTKKKSKSEKSKTNVIMYHIYEDWIVLSWLWKRRQGDWRKCSQCGKWYYEECVDLSVKDANDFECPDGCD